MTSDEFHDSVHSLISESKTLEELDAVKTCLNMVYRMNRHYFNLFQVKDSYGMEVWKQELVLKEIQMRSTNE